MAYPHETEALGLLEIDGLPRAIRAQDAALKRAPVRILACAPISPGKALLLIGGDVASVEESLNDAAFVCGSRTIDKLFLPGVHPQVIEAMRGERKQRASEALAIIELSTLAAAIESADAAVKTARVTIGRLHLATGFGGKGYFTLFGDQSEVEAAVEVAVASAGARALDFEVIPAPHDELEDGFLARPWPIDPADNHG